MLAATYVPGRAGAPTPTPAGSSDQAPEQSRNVQGARPPASNASGFSPFFCGGHGHVRRLNLASLAAPLLQMGRARVGPGRIRHGMAGWALLCCSRATSRQGNDGTAKAGERHAGRQTGGRREDSSLVSTIAYCAEKTKTRSLGASSPDESVRVPPRKRSIDAASFVWYRPIPPRYRHGTPNKSSVFLFFPPFIKNKIKQTVILKNGLRGLRCMHRIIARP